MHSHDHGSHGGGHSHTHDHGKHAHSAGTEGDAAHDYATANAHFHNEHTDAIAVSPLADYQAQQCADAILRCADFDEETTTVLDFACGPGVIAQKLAAHCLRIVGVDNSTAMVDRFNKQVSDHGVTKQEMEAFHREMLRDAEDELNGETFDVVFCAQAYHHIQDTGAVTRALYRRLKPGGTLLIIDLDGEAEFSQKLQDRFKEPRRSQFKKIVAHKGGFSKEELKDILEANGKWESIEVEVSHEAMLSEIRKIKGPGNWTEDLEEGEDLLIRHLIAVGVKVESE